MALNINLRSLGKRLQYPALVLLAGLILILLPKGQETAREEPTQPLSDVLALEAEKLEGILSQVQGAGQVRVLLSIEQTRQEQYATDRDSQGEARQAEKHILYSAGSGVQVPLIVGASAPTYRGAVVVCQGADDPAVRLALTQAVGGLTGLRSNQIVIMKMK